ncbi:MAG: hypothetical protein IIC50_06565 [Planctomycetes bacterium]|nr:hypothetical protein [Planctomycetota bacterium]
MWPSHHLRPQIARRENNPRWDPSGKALYYGRGNTMMAVGVETEPSFSATQPEAPFEGPYERNEWGTSYDVTTTPDGPKSIMIKLDQEATAVKQLNVILNRSEKLKRLVPPEEYRSDSLFLKDRQEISWAIWGPSVPQIWSL